MTAVSPRPVSAIRLDGGRLCLDFVNTIHDRFAAEAEDYLATPERYAEWARRVGIDEAVHLPQSDDARALLMADIRELRAAVHRVLAARINGVPLQDDALRVINAWLLESRKDQKLAADGRLSLRPMPGDPGFALKRIALDLVDAFDGAHAGKLKLKCCANDSSCGWMFADTSKNGKRRWCAMPTCGTLSKMATLRRRSPAS